MSHKSHLISSEVYCMPMVQGSLDIKQTQLMNGVFYLNSLEFID